MTVELPTRSNFFSALETRLSRGQIANFFGARGWKVRKSDKSEYEVSCDWAELTIDGESPILMHGLVADVVTHAEQILAPLREAGVDYTAEGYGPGRELLWEWRNVAE